MPDAMDRLQSLFRTLFQLDLADLDFGLYRLFHLKRAEVEAFITEQLPREVDAAFAEVSAEERIQLQKELESLIAQIKEQIAEDAILPTGKLKPEYRQSKIKVVRELVERYEQVRAQLEKLQVTEDYKAEVFNHLVNFFSRYYEDGDFVPKRRYGAREAYAVPYNGEEVFFHWANRDQHYVKTHERFRDYAFKVRDLTGEYRVRFTMAKASIPKNNTKGDRRYFFPRPDLATYDAEARTFTLPFEYRQPTPEEVEQYGTNSKAQEAILEEALPRILEVVPDDNLRFLLQQDQRTEKDIAEGKPELPLLLKHLRHFCRKNTSDYFIHKDLKGFLTRELEFYIKDQVLHLMDLEADLEAKRRVVRTFKRLAEKVVEFLATIEDTQKLLFEKKKFVLETDYLVPIRYVPRKFWREVLKNEAQLAEWRAWGMLEVESNLLNPEGEINEAFLEAHPTLPLHTRHFDRGFVRRLLEALPFEDLDEATDGLLVHGENYQALRLLLERYRQQIKCIYIDPPYNTGNDEFIYKDRYQHSSWLAMIDERLRLAREWMREDGVIFISIDDNEIHHLRVVLDTLFSEKQRLADLIWDLGTGTTAGHFARSHEYILSYTKSKSLLPNFSGGEGVIRHSALKKPSAKNPTSEIEFPAGIDYEGENAVFTGVIGGSEMMEIQGKMIFEEGKLKHPVKITAAWAMKKQILDWLSGKPTYDSKGQKVIRFFFNKKGILWYEKERKKINPKTVLSKVANTKQGTSALANLFGSDLSISFPKPAELVGYLVNLPIENESALVFDFFAGSGTTGHAVINLNREDGGQRKFILVEMAEYFDTVLLPRIAKVMFTPEWKDGKPKRLPTPKEAERTPRLVKILRIESYEDTLHNLAATAVRQAADETVKRREAAIKEVVGEDTYRLRYWLQLPLEEVETLLRALDLRRPFRYTIEILTDDGPVQKSVDLIETFNYLYGLRVLRYETWHNSKDDDREYRVIKATDREGKRRVLVLWRDMDGLDIEAERAFLEDKLDKMEAGGETWDEILINGDTPAPRVVSLDPLFKRLMMEGER